ncbi:putative leader peptide [Streptomyces sp. CC224E]|uniref:putative leader peptide n=1 Tax=unclassified Streptomyces TaxID=2593676 RepID=UPI003556BC3E
MRTTRTPSRAHLSRLLLTSRRHIDLGRTSSAICRAIRVRSSLRASITAAPPPPFPERSSPCLPHALAPPPCAISPP